jgi:hypothetical protein
MIDYHPFVSRAVAVLELSTEESRRALYERARNAQLTHLRQAAFTEAAIERERLALEEAIRDVELREATKQTAHGGYREEASAQSALSGSQPQSRQSKPFGITEDNQWVISTTALILAMNAAGAAVLWMLMQVMN